MTRRTALTLAIVAVLALVTACAGGDDASDGDGARATTTTTAATDAGTSPDTTGTPTTAPPFRPEPIAWEPCGDGVECGTLTVPLDHADPAGATIDLAVARRPALVPDQRIGVLVANPGGPGASGTDLVRRGLGVASLGDRFDLVSWDPRGVGDRAPLACGDQPAPYRASDLAPDDEVEQRRLEAAARTLAETCGRLDADLLPHLGTDAAVADLDVLRRALGEERVSYLGLSYGTLLGQRYADAHPERVRAMVLDAVVDPALDLAGLVRSQALGVEAALDRALGACADGDCPVDDARRAYDEVAARVEREPLPAEGGAVGPTEVVLAGIVATYGERSWPRLWSALAAAVDGDGSGLRTLADSFVELVPYTPYVAVLCADWARPGDLAGWRSLADDLAALAPRTGRALASELLPCAWWPTPGRPSTGPVDAAGTSPILVVGATGDAATPYDSAVAVATALDDAVLLTHEYDGHVSTTASSCVAGHVAAYLVSLATPPPGTVC